jgi:hypothetical protein
LPGPSANRLSIRELAEEVIRTKDQPSYSRAEIRSILIAKFVLGTSKQKKQLVEQTLQALKMHHNKTVTLIDSAAALPIAPQSQQTGHISVFRGTIPPSWRQAESAFREGTASSPYRKLYGWQGSTIPRKDGSRTIVSYNYRIQFQKEPQSFENEADREGWGLNNCVFFITSSRDGTYATGSARCPYRVILRMKFTD